MGVLFAGGLEDRFCLSGLFVGASRDCTGVYSEAGSEGVSAAISVLCVFVWRRYGADPAGDGKGIGCEGMEM